MMVLLKRSNPLVNTTDLGNDAYIVSIANLPTLNSYALALALNPPSSAISICDPVTLQEKERWIPHCSITQLKSYDGDQLISSGKDGTVHRWDDRIKGGKALTLIAPNGHALLSFDMSKSQNLIAAGTEYQNEEALILYWDVRSSQQLVRTHSSTHSDDITNLAFVCRRESETILSTSTDGLLSSSNPTEDDEDEAVLNVANWGTSISKAGFISQVDEPQYLWTGSDMETFAIWNLELDPVSEFGDIRTPRATLPVFA